MMKAFVDTDRARRSCEYGIELPVVYVMTNGHGVNRIPMSGNRVCMFQGRCNAHDMGIKPRSWKVWRTTQRHRNTPRHACYNNNRFQNFVRVWR